jgi:hypothetical protein
VFFRITWHTKLFFAIILLASFLRSQSPDAALRVLVTTADGMTLSNAEVTASLSDRGIERPETTGGDGMCFFPSLPPGIYTIRVALPGYTIRLLQGIKLDVAAHHEISVLLTPVPTGAGDTEGQVKSILEAAPPAPVLGVETVASSVSVVVGESKILQLPLLNRNVYSLFLLQPGVTSQEASEARGLRFSVHGQRVSGSNYLLDGVDNNNLTLTGPVTITSLEGVQEFRMINSSFSADTGRATSFVAQAITSPGTNTLHGGVFGYLSNDALDANTFFNNAFGEPKTPLHTVQTGYTLGGPIIHNRTYFFTSLELSRFHFSTSQQIKVPTQTFIASLPPSSPFRALFATAPPIALPAATDPDYGTATVQVPNRIDTLFFTGRVDHVLHAGRDRLAARYTLSATQQRVSDDSSGEEYQGNQALWPTDRFSGHNTMLGWTHTFESASVNDLRLGWNRYRPDLPRPFTDHPSIQIFSPCCPFLASSPRFGIQRENDNLLQLTDRFSVRRGRSSLTLGFELRRNLDNGVNSGLENSAFGGEDVPAAGFFQFDDLASVRANNPLWFEVAVDRFSNPLQLANLDRSYRSTDGAAFVQDDFKLSRRFSINIGLRWEHFGVIHNTDRSKDINFYFGPGSTPEERIANGVLRRTTDNPGDMKGVLYRPDFRDFAPSVGFAWDPFGYGKTIVRAGYAIAYDRIYDTARDVRTNSSRSVICYSEAGAASFLVQYPICPTLSLMLPVQQMLPLIPFPLLPAPAVIIDEHLRTPYAQNWYFGIQQNITPTLMLEEGHAASVGRKLVSRDLVNRDFLLPSLANTNDDNFISSQGNSNYLSLEVRLTQRVWHGLQYQLSYTWSHAIDNQSDLLEGVRTGPDRTDVAIAGFTSTLDPRFDRADANFDQRHNFIVNAIWEVPAPRSRWRTLIGGWSISGIGGIRSGFPVTVISATGLSDAGFLNSRADLVGDPGSFKKYDVPGGRQWLSPSDFSLAAGGPGTLGRNALPGPGSWNCDLAVMRNFSFKDSRLHLQLRGEFYDAFNHANLSPPVSDLSQQQTFGVSYAGFSQTFSRFGELPLDNVSRQIQLALRVTF